jgi:hypothetical protein
MEKGDRGRAWLQNFPLRHDISQPARHAIPVALLINATATGTPYFPVLRA